MFAAFGCATVVCAFRTVRPKRLELTREGLKCSRLIGSSLFVEWRDVDRFYVTSTRSGDRISFTGRRVEASTETFPAVWRVFRRWGDLGGAWRGSTDRVVDLLEEWRVFYS